MGSGQHGQHNARSSRSWAHERRGVHMVLKRTTYAVPAVMSLAEHQLLVGDAFHNMCCRGGYASPGDDGGGTFVWTDDVDFNQNDDPLGILAVVPTVGPRIGTWKRLDANEINVRWAGAVGDGVIDDTIAIQAAIDLAQSSGIGRVRVPRGTYLISVQGTSDAYTQCLTLPSGVALEGDGRNVATLKVVGAIDLRLMIDARMSIGIAVRGLRFLGDNGALGVGYARTVKWHGFAILAQGAIDVVVEDCAFESLYAIAIADHAAGSRLVFQHNVLRWCYGINSNQDGGEILDNYLEDAWAIEDSGHYARIHDNVLLNCYSSGIASGGDVTRLTVGASICRNRIRNTVVSHSASFGITVPGGRATQIRGNIIDGTSAAGIYVYAFGATSADVVIADNYVDNSNMISGFGVGFSGIAVDGCTGVSVRDNTVRTPAVLPSATWCLAMSAANNAVIVGNDLHNSNIDPGLPDVYLADSTNVLLRANQYDAAKFQTYGTVTYNTSTP